MWQDDLAKTSELIEYNFSTGRMTSQVVERRDEEITYNIRYQKHYFMSPTEVARVNKGKTTEIFTSTNQMIIDLDKLVELVDADGTKGLKPIIDNLYYHVGALKGCKK